MYCRSCGNKLGDMDRFCQVCGTPTGYQEPPAAPAETSEIKEEIVFNPPYENKSHFAEEEPPFEAEEAPAAKKEEEDLQEFISEDEIEAHKQEKDTDSSEPLKNAEFAWNVHEFPGTTGAKKTEEIIFNWNMEDFNQPEEKEPEVKAFEEELFQEIRDESNRIKEQNIDRFFTFSKKNEEFQKLLDKEYEKFKMSSEPIESAAVPEETQFHEVTLDTEVPAEEPLKEAEPTVEEVIIPEAPEVAAKSEQVLEMARARAQFFGEELIRDNDSIKKKLEPIEHAEEPVVEQVEVPAFEQESKKEEEHFIEATETEEPIETEEPVETEEEGSNGPERVAAFTPLAIPTFPGVEEKEAEEKEEETEEEKETDGKHKRSVGQILLAIIAIILVIEILILGIRYFAPNSAAAEAIGNTQTEIFNTVSGWMGGINDLFSGNDSDEDAVKPDDSDKDNAGEEEQPPVEQPSDTDTPAPDPNPTADKNALVSSQLGNNRNIEQVKANEALIYQAGKDYGLVDINNSKPITNNIWQTPEKADPVYYDKSVVGTIIAFDSQWIDYVNGGSKSVLDLLKKDSEAYRKTANFSKIGKIKETFKLLEIGEIRQGSKGFYIWVHEELQITENGTTVNKKYNWVYYLEPVDGKMQIVNYF